MDLTFSLQPPGPQRLGEESAPLPRPQARPLFLAQLVPTGKKGALLSQLNTAIWNLSKRLGWGHLTLTGCKLGESHYWSTERMCTPFITDGKMVTYHCPQIRLCWPEGTTASR